MPCAQVQTDFISLSLLCSCLEELSYWSLALRDLSISVMLKLIFLHLLHGIKVLRDWNIISVDRSWTLRHTLENVADGTVVTKGIVDA